MCAAYTIQGAVKDFLFPTTLAVQNLLPYEETGLRVVPYRKAPVFIRDDKKIVLTEMSFSLVPSWSKERKVKFATHNARLETVLEKPTWKKPFLNQRALVPISYFVEPIYDNELAGHMVRFHAQGQTFLYAAGIYDEWTDKESGEILSSFSIVTTEPPEDILKAGHDRCPVFLKSSGWEQWLEPGPQDGKALMQILKENRADWKFQTAIDRPMRPGWEKRKGS